MSLARIQTTLLDFAPEGVPAFSGEADDSEGTLNPPWLVGTLWAPSDIHGELATHGAEATWVVTVSGGNAEQALVWAHHARNAWNGARPKVPGYNLSMLRLDRPVGPYPAGLTATDTDLRYQVIKLPFTFTITRL